MSSRSAVVARGGSRSTGTEFTNSISRASRRLCALLLRAPLFHERIDALLELVEVATERLRDSGGGRRRAG